MYKRSFVDWEKEVWADPSPATKGDVLQEGMQVGTGTKSWAQLQWSYITARAWENSVYAIAPNQRLVYLMGGEMLYQLDKNRKDKSDYFVWTKLIQARIRGTTVLFQCTKDTTRLTVLEGTVDVLNRKDKSVVRVEPGVVYEVKELHPEISSETINSVAQSAVIGSASTSATSSATASASNTGLTAITQNGIPPVKVFETKQTLTTLLVANPSSLLNHPLVNALESPLSSLPLVGSTLGALIPTVGSLLDGVGGVATGLLNQTLLSEVKILSVPKSLNYKVGPEVGSAFLLPPMATSYFPPVGMIGQMGGGNGVLPNLTPQGAISNITEIGNMGGMSRGVGGLVPTIVPNIQVIPTTTTAVTTGFTGATAALSGLGGLGGVTSGAVAGVTGGVAGTTGALGGVLGGATGALGGVTGGVTGALGGGASGGGMLGGAGGTINGVLQGAGGALGGLLGGGGSGGLLGLPGH